MNIRFHSIEQMPRWVPVWPQLMDNLCQPEALRVARALGISVRSVRRYNATGEAPRPVLLAVFWLTTWGRSQVHTQAVNDAAIANQYLGALARRVDELEGLVDHLKRIGQFGSANDPGHTPRGKRHALPR